MKTTTELVHVYMYLSRMKNQHGHGVCWISTTREKRLYVKNAQIHRKRKKNEDKEKKEKRIYSVLYTYVLVNTKGVRPSMPVVVEDVGTLRP